MAQRGRHYRRRRHSALGTLLKLVLLAVLVYVGFCGVSAWRIKGLYDDVMASTQSCRESIEALDVEAAYADVNAVAQYLTDLDQETHSWQWNLARRLPVIGEDVGLVQDMVFLYRALANDAVVKSLLPVEDLIGTTEASDFLAVIKEKLGQVSDLTDALVESKEVVSSCADAASQLPASHFDALNDQVDKLKKITSEANAQLSNFGSLLSVTDVVGDVAGLVSGQ